MSNNLGLAGAQSQKPTRFAPLYTGRWSSGIWTNRSPLRDATTSRIAEKFYGQAGDAMMAGLNVEVTNKLTLARRPGLSVYDSHSYDAVDRFYDFRIFGTSTEQIIVMIDQANVLYALQGGVRSTVLTKSAGAGQTYMQSVGNTLYFGDGVETGKWLQTLNVWQASTIYGTSSNPFLSFFFIDANGHMLQAVGSTVPVTATNLVGSTPTAAPILTITSSVNLSTYLAAGDVITFPNVGMSATWLEGQSCTILNFPSTTTVTVTYPLPWEVAPGTTTETVNAIAYNAGTPTSGSTQPVGPGPVRVANALTPGYVVDGQVVWADRGSQTENWGISIEGTSKVPFSAIPSDQAIVPSPANPGYSLSFYSAYPPSSTFTAGTYVVDPNNNIQYTAAGGTSGAISPAWNKIINQDTTDGTITWELLFQGALSPQNGGYQYAVALVNSLDNTVSNYQVLSNATGNFIGATGFYIPPGSGLPIAYRPFPMVFDVVNIDTQADYVAIFRTTDGQAVPFLIPGASGVTQYTLPLAQYLLEGYLDVTQDTQLNNLISAPTNLENTVPATQAVNLTYHLNRIFYSVGNVVYWTDGPDTPIGNGVNGINPLNFDSMPSLVTRLVPTSAGLLVFTVSDVYLIQGNGTSASPILGAIPLLPGIGLLNYNALDMNGPIIGLFTTDSQFIILDPSSGTTNAGLPIGDQLRLNNGNPGTSWNPATAYVAWHVQGEDQAWYIGDAVNGWYRLMSTPAPETGFTWSPFADLTNGVKALQSIEVSPGVHRLLVGPVGVGEILQRDLTVFSDNGTAYPAFAVVGSAVLTQPGQVALVDHITTDAVKVGSPLVIGVLVDDALPYYTGPIDLIEDSVSDPPNLKPSRSFWSQRFYMSSTQEEAAVMRHMQIKVIFNSEDTVQNELLTLTVFGAYNQEI